VTRPVLDMANERPRFGELIEDGVNDLEVLPLIVGGHVIGLPGDAPAQDQVDRRRVIFRMPFGRRGSALELVTGVVPGDYVIIHVGYALQRLDPDEAARTLALFAEAGAANDGASAEAA